MVDTSKLDLLAAVAHGDRALRNILLPSTSTRASTTSSCSDEATSTPDWSRLAALADVAADAKLFSVPNRSLHALQQPFEDMQHPTFTHQNYRPLPPISHPSSAQQHNACHLSPTISAAVVQEHATFLPAHASATSTAPSTPKSPVFSKWAARQRRVPGKAPKRGFTVEEVGRGWRACARCRKNKSLRSFRTDIRTCRDCEQQKRDTEAVASGAT